MRKRKGSIRTRKNVLFIAVDDLRCNLGCYGDQFAVTPNIDGLAARGTVFLRAYCQQAVCGPSRASFMTGRRPDSTGVLDNPTHFREHLPEVITLPEHFKNAGYHAQSIGKVFHNGVPDPQSWSVPQSLDIDTFHWGRSMYALPENREHDRKGVSMECSDLPDSAFRDGQIADRAVAALGSLRDQPFFLGVGFLKPHLPFCAPKKYWDLYDRDTLSRPVPERSPEGAPKLALHNWVELRGYTDIPAEGPLTREKIAELRHGYYASTSFTDAQIGKVLDELDRLGLSEKTVIVLWSDNGWHLGEQNLWCKFTNFELDTRVPLIVSAPGQRTPGGRSDGLVEAIDVYPAPVELCGLGMPLGLDGMSLAHLLDDPDETGKEAAYSQFPRPWRVGRGDFEIMGYTMRTDRWRYTEWIRLVEREVVARELYDHRDDPLETVNLGDREEHAALVLELNQLLNTVSAGTQHPGG